MKEKRDEWETVTRWTLCGPVGWEGMRDRQARGLSQEGAGVGKTPEAGVRRKMGSLIPSKPVGVENRGGRGIWLA